MSLSLVCKLQSSLVYKTLIKIVDVLLGLTSIKLVALMFKVVCVLLSSLATA